MFEILTLVATLLGGIGGILIWVHFAKDRPRLLELAKRMLESSVLLGIVLIVWDHYRG